MGDDKDGEGDDKVPTSRSLGSDADAGEGMRAAIGAAIDRALDERDRMGAFGLLPPRRRGPLS